MVESMTTELVWVGYIFLFFFPALCGANSWSTIFFCSIKSFKCLKIVLRWFKVETLVSDIIGQLNFYISIWWLYVNNETGKIQLEKVGMWGSSVLGMVLMRAPSLFSPSLKSKRMKIINNLSFEVWGKRAGLYLFILPINVFTLFDKCDFFSFFFRLFCSAFIRKNKIKNPFQLLRSDCVESMVKEKESFVRISGKAWISFAKSKSSLFEI